MKWLPPGAKTQHPIKLIVLFIITIYLSVKITLRFLIGKEGFAIPQKKDLFGGRFHR